MAEENEAVGFDAATMIGEDGNFNDAGRSHLTANLGEGFEDYKGLDDYKTVASLAKGLAETKKAYSAKQEGMVKMLTAESTEDEVKAYREAKGVPDKYEITRRKDADGKDMEFDEVGTQMIHEWMQKQNYSQAEAQGLMDMYDQYEESMITRMAEAQVAESKEANEAFNLKHGGEEKAKAVRKMAGIAMEKTGFTEKVLPGLIKKYPGIENDPAIADWFVEDIGKKMLPGQLHDHQTTPKTEEKTGLEGIYDHEDSQKLRERR